MHLDILYKTVPFLEKEKILNGLPEYIEQKKLTIEEQDSNLQTPKKPETIEPGRRGPKPKISHFEGDQKEIPSD
jgi:hypothetical protein